jgi:2-oxoglutarate ferredoxin oxidoreductase subunit alpha
VIEDRDKTEVGILAYGSCDPAVQEARAILKEEGMLTDYCRVRAVPFTEAVREFIRTHQRVYVVEMNRDGQMHQLLLLDVPELSEKLISTARLDGLPFTAAWIVNQLRTGEEN